MTENTKTVVKKRKKKKSARQRRVLFMSLLCALVILMGGTFAVLTSVDAVTNRLHSDTDLGVTIIEKYSPPNTITEGMSLNKDTYATNTGNSDVFVKMSIDTELNVTKIKGTTGTAPTLNSQAGYIEIKETQFLSMESGGRLAFAGVITGGTDSTDCTAKAFGDTDVIGKNAGTDITYSDAIAKAIATGTTKAEAFVPTETGLYVFEREKEVTMTSATSTTTTTYVAVYAFVGVDSKVTYYKVDTAKIKEVEANGAGVTFYAKDNTETTCKSEYKDSYGIFITTEELKLNAETAYKTASSDIASTEIKSGDKYIEVEFKNGSGADEVSYAKFDIKLNHVILDTDTGTTVTAEKWQQVDNSSKTDFYYTSVLKSGATTNQLIDSVYCADIADSSKYYDFDFDIDVNLASTQALKKDGKYDEIENNNALAAATDWYCASDLNKKKYIGITKVDFDSTDKTSTIITWSATEKTRS